MESRKLKVVKKENNEKFIKVYTDEMSALFNIGSKTTLHFLFYLWKHVSFNNECFDMGIHKRKEVASKFGVSLASLNKSVIDLRNGNIILDTDRRGYYMLNPKIFFKGNDSERYAKLRIMSEFNMEASIKITIIENKDLIKDKVIDNEMDMINKEENKKFG